MALFPEQVGLLNTAPPTVFLAGPPGTGKSVVLLLMAMEWLRRGSDTRIVSTCRESRAACSMLRHLLQQTVTSLPSDPLPPGQVHLLQYDFQTEDIVKRAVDELVQAAGAGPLHVIIDEAGPDDRYDHFQLFCKELLTRVPSLHLWAASCYHGHAPADWPVEYLTRPLRFPPAVARQVEQDTDMKVSRRVRTYSRRSVPDVTDGPPVTVRLHKGQGHSMHEPASNCERCGQDLADFLSTLGVGGQGTCPTLEARRRR
ncbi:uncharacterized protein LOC112569087 isoform X2 [Pomacea canaliculata]|uniref:uncharacterized protein LOC112569087 isoform X2 n=1 Tax=Pomacea canaliculata TaxID=400727 RepID=UPI000D72971F|nr:uncharacterized protein LOC112569087 isoform X2 [Pomacea canaliculata]